MISPPPPPSALAAPALAVAVRAAAGGLPGGRAIAAGIAVVRLDGRERDGHFLETITGVIALREEAHHFSLPYDPARARNVNGKCRIVTGPVRGQHADGRRRCRSLSA